MHHDLIFSVKPHVEYEPPPPCPASTFTAVAPYSPLKHTALIQANKCLHSTRVHRAGCASLTIPPWTIKEQIEETDRPLCFPQASYWLLQQ